MAGGAYVVIALTFGISTGVVGRAKGSSFLIWFVVGAVLPFLGLIAVILYRVEKDEPERKCPRCGAVVKLYWATYPFTREPEIFGSPPPG